MEITPNFTFSGLASGLDTGAIIDALVQAESIPILRLESHKARLERQDSLLGRIDSKLDALKTAADKLRDLDGVASFSATSSDESVLDATVSGSATGGFFDLDISALARAETQASTGFSSSDATVYSGPDSYSFDITVDGETHTIQLSGDVSLDDIKTAIQDSDAPVHAAVINTNSGTDPYQLVLTSEETGTQNAVTLDFSSEPGLGTALQFSTIQSASDASFTLNGLQVTNASNDVEGVVQGVTLHLRDTGSATLSLETDGGKVRQEIEGFVEAYNDLASLLDSQNVVDEDGQTDAPLFGDSTVRHLGSRLSDAVLREIDGLSGTFTSLASVGVTLDGAGRLEIDSEELDEALATDRAAVMAVFTTESTGLGDRIAGMVDSVTDPENGLIQVRRDGIERRQRTLDQRIENMERRLGRFEERLVERFASFEQLISSFQAQGAALGIGTS